MRHRTVRAARPSKDPPTRLHSQNHPRRRGVLGFLVAALRRRRGRRLVVAPQRPRARILRPHDVCQGRDLEGPVGPGRPIHVPKRRSDGAAVRSDPVCDRGDDGWPMVVHAGGVVPDHGGHGVWRWHCTRDGSARWTAKDPVQVISWWRREVGRWEHGNVWGDSCWVLRLCVGAWLSVSGLYFSLACERDCQSSGRIDANGP
mmetsp:Transcript_28117/g.57492  ORF Transcript_28117/g.57492 Transcript_28117/m.57492 type:complete len:202 (+) Transcript_28117:129-734(+)